MADRPRLAELADSFGILPVYTDLQGVERFTEYRVRERLLSACGVDASTEEGAEAELARLKREEHGTVLAPVHVSAHAGRDAAIPVRLPPDWSGGGSWRAEFAAENGGLIVREGDFDAAAQVSGGANSAISIPDEIDEGYYELRLAVARRGDQIEARQRLVITPSRCRTLDERIGAGRAFGVWTNLYSVRSEANWGAGDLQDLDTLAREAARHDTDFVGVNPLHATSNRGEGISPYNPVSRLFRNPIYIDVEAVPELARSPEAQGIVGSAEVQGELCRLRSCDRVDYERVMALKLRVMRALHAAFVELELRRASPRGAAYRDYVAGHGETLTAFARFMARRERHDLPYINGDAATPAAFGQSQDVPQAAVDLHCYMQFELDRQLGESHMRALKAGMRLGLYDDVALGSTADGSDALTYPGLLVDGIEVGAPPDAYSAVGQKWGFPPLNPHRLRARGYDYWIAILRSAMAHAGLLRLDHVMGLFRQFWVPREEDARGGAYVRYPSQDLLGILALESRRHGAVIVGEDLGTVPPEVPAAMERYGILSSRLMIFEREWDGSFRPPQRCTREALVMATNHDYPPLAGYWNGRDLDVRLEHGLIDAQTADGGREARTQLQHALLRAINDAGIEFEPSHPPPPGSQARTPAPGSPIDRQMAQQLCRAVYAFLARTNCRLVGVSLDDLAGEMDPVNLPGVPVAKFPNWTRRMKTTLGDVIRSNTFRDVFDDLRRSVRDVCE